MEIDKLSSQKSSEQSNMLSRENTKGCCYVEEQATFFSRILHSTQTLFFLV